MLLTLQQLLNKHKNVIPLKDAIIINDGNRRKVRVRGLSVFAIRCLKNTLLATISATTCVYFLSYHKELHLCLSAARNSWTRKCTSTPRLHSILLSSTLQAVKIPDLLSPFFNTASLFENVQNTRQSPKFCCSAMWSASVSDITLWMQLDITLSLEIF